MNNKIIGLGCVGVLLLGVLILVATGVGGYNKLVPARENLDRSWGNVQSAYQRRLDLIPNLVKTVEGAANFEKSTLTEVINARANATKVTVDMSHAPTDPAQLQQFQQAQQQLSSGLSRLLAVSERYPELKANQNFRDLQAQIEGTENRINVARNDFNVAAQHYNTLRSTFPTVIIANFTGFQERPYFQSAAGADTAPSVNFGSFGASPTPAPSH